MPVDDAPAVTAELSRMQRAIVRVAVCLTDPAMTADNVWGWQAVLDASWDNLDAAKERNS